MVREFFIFMFPQYTGRNFDTYSEVLNKSPPPITVVGKIWSRWSLLGTSPTPTPPTPLFLNYSEFSIKVKEKDNGNKLPDQVSTFFLNIIHSLLELLFQYLRYLEHLLNIFSTFNLRPVPMGYLSYSKTEKNNKII